jgi:hypothetical protein
MKRSLSHCERMLLNYPDLVVYWFHDYVEVTNVVAAALAVGNYRLAYEEDLEEENPEMFRWLRVPHPVPIEVEPKIKMSWRA